MSDRHPKIDIDWVEFLELQMEFEELEEIRAQRMIDLVQLTIESLGSWQAAEALGFFDHLDPAPRHNIWMTVPLSRGGGATSLEAELDWDQLIQGIADAYGPAELKRMRDVIDEMRRASSG